MSIFRFSFVAAAAALALQSCAPGQDAPAPSSAALDLSRYVAVGDSYTAGVSNGGLTRNSQLYSYPNLLAQSFAQVAPGASFTQPLLEQGASTNYLTLVSYNGRDLPVVRRVAGSAVRSSYVNTIGCGLTDTVRLLARSAQAGTLPQNLGLPGLRLSQLESPDLGNEANAVSGRPFNPYFERLLPQGDSRSYLQAVTTASAQATFFTYFAGFDEFLPYIRSGGTCAALLPNATALGTNVRKVLSVLAANGRRGIIVQVPNLNLLPILSLGRGLSLQRRLQQATGRTDTTLYITTNSGNVRPIGDGDFVLATAISRIGTAVSGSSSSYGYSAQTPIVNADVIDEIEFNRINVPRTTLNRILNDEARDTYKLPAIGATWAFDLEGFLSQVNANIGVNGVTYGPEPVRGNFYSLDYYSLTPRGNALVANAIIKAINQGYRSSIPYVNVDSLPTSVE